MSFYRADCAARLAWKTNHRPEIHEGRVERSGAAAGHESLREIPDCFLPCAGVDRDSQIQQSRNNARNVCFHQGKGLAGSEGGDRIGGVKAKARELAQLLRRTRKNARVSLHHDFRARVKIAGPCVISKALPRMQNLGFGSGRKRGCVREASQPTMVIRDHCLHLCLLQHELRNCYGIRVARAAPGQFAAMASIPARKSEAKR